MKNLWPGALLAVCLVGGCISQYGAEESELIHVVVTILPQAEFTEKVGGDRVLITVMVPPGASPHTYEPTPHQLVDVSKAAMYFQVGSGVEFELVWMDKLIDTNKDMVVVDCSEGIELIHTGHEPGEEHERYDPHIWLSLKNAQIMVENIYKGLVQVDPAHQEYYAKNKDLYIQELDNLDKEVFQALSGKKNRKIMVYHPSWAYFCRDYGLEQIPIEKEGKEPTPQGIAHVIEQAKAYGITIIFASPQFNSESAQVVAREIGGKVVLIDPLAENYLENLKKVAEAFAEV